MAFWIAKGMASTLNLKPALYYLIHLLTPEARRNATEIDTNNHSFNMEYLDKYGPFSFPLLLREDTLCEFFQPLFLILLTPSRVPLSLKYRSLVKIYRIHTFKSP